MATRPAAVVVATGAARGGTGRGAQMTTSSADAARRRVTRADVARYAGVSTAVVSYVVNGGPKRVSAPTTERVLEAVRILGYQPNLAARSLRTGSSQLIGLVLPALANPLFAELALAIEQAAARRGYTVLVTNSESDAETERRHIANLSARQVDGMILTTVLAASTLDTVAASRIPTVLLNRFESEPGFEVVGVDAFRGAYDGVTHLIEHGHTRIGIVVGHTLTSGVEVREQGWLAALRRHGLQDGPVAREDFSRLGGYRAGLRLFGGVNPPPAVFCSSDMQAVGVLRALAEIGLRVPDDVAIVSFDGTEESEYTNPRLTTMRQPVASMGEDAVRRVLGERDDEPEHATYVPELILRDSCGPHR